VFVPGLNAGVCAVAGAYLGNAALPEQLFQGQACDQLVTSIREQRGVDLATISCASAPDTVIQGQWTAARLQARVAETCCSDNSSRCRPDDGTAQTSSPVPTPQSTPEATTADAADNVTGLATALPDLITGGTVSPPASVQSTSNDGEEDNGNYFGFMIGGAVIGAVILVVVILIVITNLRAQRQPQAAAQQVISPLANNPAFEPEYAAVDQAEVGNVVPARRRLDEDAYVEGGAVNQAVVAPQAPQYDTVECAQYDTVECARDQYAGLGRHSTYNSVETDA